MFYKSASEILQCAAEGVLCNFQGLLVVCDDFSSDMAKSAEGPPRKRQASDAKIARVIFVDKTGAINACLWGEIAEDICCMWRLVHESGERGQGKTCVVELNKVRIMNLPKNSWNGENLTRHRILHSVEHMNREGGTTMKMLERPTADNLLKMPFVVPPPDCCVTVFRALRNKLTPPFRLSAKGKIVDLQSMAISQAGNPKRVFDLVDGSGVYFTCCAMYHNAHSPALENYQDVVIYFGKGSGPIGCGKGMLYLMKDTMIISIGKPSLMSAPKTEQLWIQ